MDLELVVKVALVGYVLYAVLGAPLLRAPSHGESFRPRPGRT